MADSSSEDKTKEIAKEVLQGSSLENARWKIMNFDFPGKNVALNGVLDEIDSEIIVISDADALISPGWLKIVSFQDGGQGGGSSVRNRKRDSY